METSCIGKSDTNSLPASTDLTENPYGGKLYLKDATQNSASMVPHGILIEFVPWRPTFENKKCSHLNSYSTRGGGGADAHNTRWLCVYPCSAYLRYLTDHDLNSGSA
jgi:hypothetical protein